MKEQRIEKVLALMNDQGLDACLLIGMDNIYYLSGFRGSEGSLLITRGDVLLITDFRYITHAQETTQGIKIVETRGSKNILKDVCETYGLRKIGFDSLHASYFVYRKWSETMPDVELVPLDNVIEEIRKNKDPDEIDAIVRAVDVATRAFTEVFNGIRPGQTEREVANNLDYTMRRLGAQYPSFPTIVASGPRAALPHAEPTDRVIQKGDMIIIDFGAHVNGYCSDETCTISVGDVNGILRDIYEIVKDAKKQALDAIKPGMLIKELDGVVRGYIEKAGYGEFYRHGTGHGVGIAVHEAPAINSGAEGSFEEGMVVTIEPGIYIPNLGGVRLEDMVLITAGSPRVLTRIRKDELCIPA